MVQSWDDAPVCLGLLGYIVDPHHIASILKFTSKSKMAASTPTITSAFQPIGKGKGEKAIPLLFKDISKQTALLTYISPS